MSRCLFWTRLPCGYKVFSLLLVAMIAILMGLLLNYSIFLLNRVRFIRNLMIRGPTWFPRWCCLIDEISFVIWTLLTAFVTWNDFWGFLNDISLAIVSNCGLLWWSTVDLTLFHVTAPIISRLFLNFIMFLTICLFLRYVLHDTIIALRLLVLLMYRESRVISVLLSFSRCGTSFRISLPSPPFLISLVLFSIMLSYILILIILRILFFLLIVLLIIAFVVDVVLILLIIMVSTPAKTTWAVLVIAFLALVAYLFEVVPGWWRRRRLLLMLLFFNSLRFHLIIIL